MATILPEHILKLVSPEDRKALGKWGLTSAEAQAKWQIRNERDLHKQIGNLLRLRGIEFVESRMDRKTTQKRGVPDFLFAVQVESKTDVVKVQPCGYGGGSLFISKSPVQQTRVIACAWEVKYADGKLSEEQATMLHRMSTPPNGWRVAIIRSVNEALEELKKYGL